MWELNGEAYNQDDIQFVADQMGISFDEYVKKFNLKKLDDGIEIMEEIDIKSDPFSLDTITDVIGDDFYKIDSKEGSDRINKLLEGSDIEFNRDEAKLVHFAGVGGPMNPPNTYNESNTKYVILYLYLHFCLHLHLLCVYAICISLYVYPVVLHVL